MSKLIPLKRKVVVKGLEQKQETDFGLVLSATKNEDRPMMGVVVSVGPDVGCTKDECDDCKSEECQNDCCKSENAIKEGVTILFSKYSPTEVDLDGEKLLIVDEKDILAVVEK